MREGTAPTSGDFIVGFFAVFAGTAFGMFKLLGQLHQHVPADCPADAFLAIIPRAWDGPAIMLPTFAATLAYIAVMRPDAGPLTISAGEGGVPLRLPFTVPLRVAVALTVAGAIAAISFVAGGAVCMTPAGIELRRGALLPRHAAPWSGVQDFVATCLPPGKHGPAITLRMIVAGDELVLAPDELLAGQDGLIVALRANQRALRLVGFDDGCSARGRSGIQDIAEFRLKRQEADGPSGDAA